MTPGGPYKHGDHLGKINLHFEAPGTSSSLTVAPVCGYTKSICDWDNTTVHCLSIETPEDPQPNDELGALLVRSHTVIDTNYTISPAYLLTLSNAYTSFSQCVLI